MVDLACRCCSSQQLQDWGNCAPFPSRLIGDLQVENLQSGRLLRCSNCGLGQRSPCLEDDQLTAIYQQMPAGTMAYPFAENAAWRTAKQQLLAQWTEQDDISVLDVGCHEGGFLHELPKRWRRFGIESAAAPRRIAGDRGVTLIAQRLESLTSEWQGKFNAVTMFDVLEHLREPGTGLAQAAALLRPGGLLIVSTGDLDAWTWRWFSGEHWYLQSPLHLSFGSGKFFDYIAKREGLRVHNFNRIPHRLGTLGQRWRDRVEAFYFGARLRGGLWRIPQRFIQSLPGWRYLHHRQATSSTFRLRDHVLVTYTR